MTRFDMRTLAARFSFALLSLAASASASVAQAQRPTTPPRRASTRGDTIQHSPFIPGGHWRPGRPAPIPEPVPDLPVATATVPAADSAGYFARPNALLLRTDTSVYQLEIRRDTALVPLGVRTVTVSASMLGGAPDWLVAESRTGTAIATYDSVHLHRVDLTPVRWTARNGLSQLAVSFTQDSMFVALQDYQGRGSFAAALPPGALLTPAMVDQLLTLLPLADGYHANASLVVIDSGAPRAVPATISVEGGASVMLAVPAAVVASGAPSAGVQLAGVQAPAPAVPVDCWVVVLRAGSLEKRYWVSKSSQRVVKTEQATSAGVLTELLQQRPPGS
jgi:hypothetical protein